VSGAARRAGVLALPAALLLAAAGCGVPVQRDAEGIPASQVPYGLLSPSAAPSAKPTTGTPYGNPVVYLVRPDDTLVALPRPADGDTLEDRLRDLLAALTGGPTVEESAQQLTTDLGPGITLRVRGVEAGTATVELAGTGDLPAGRESRLAVAEIVLTATSLPGVDAVSLTRGGSPLEAPLPSGQLTDGPLTAADYAALAATGSPPS
jgi:hypothetical protein